MSRKQRSTIISGLIVLAFVAFYYWLTINLPPGPPFEQISTKFVPTLLSGLLAVLSILMIIAAFIEKRPAGTPDKEARPKGDRAAFIATLLIVFGSLPAWKLIGFLCIPFMTAGVMAANRIRRVRQIVAVSLVMTLLLYVVFFRLFELPLPLGLLE